MRQGFFKESTLISKPPEYRVARCESCKLYLKCKSPKMPVTGKGRKKILIVGEFPSKNDDDQNKHFVGQSGQFLSQALHEIGIDLRKDCWMTNAIICHPSKNRTPKDKEIQYCRPNLTNTIRELNPEIIIPLGTVAVKSLISPLWKEQIGPLERWVGWKIPCQELNTWIVPNWHPSHVVRVKESAKQQGQILEKLYIHNFSKIKELIGTRPWEQVPDYFSQIKLLQNTDMAAAFIRDFIKKGGPCTFDIETNMLKPDSPRSDIVCASVCWKGESTIAFPWSGEAIVAMKEFLKSDSPKWGQNIKFEDRWMRKHLRTSVRNWEWDGMLGMHWLDNRRGITGLKFQSFVLFGYGSYDDHINKFLKAKTSNTLNKIREIDMKQLLRYCGLDSFLEYKICELQRENLP